MRIESREKKFAEAFPSALPAGTNVDTLKADLD